MFYPEVFEAVNRVKLLYGGTSKGTIAEECTSFEELCRRMEQINLEYQALVGVPFSVDLVREGAGRLSVGLGENRWMLFYTSEDGEVLNSLGDREATGTTIFFFGDHTELSHKYLVPADKGLEGVKLCFEEGRLSNGINWTEEIF